MAADRKRRQSQQEAPGSGGSTFDWYLETARTARGELEHFRSRAYQATKIQLVILAGALVLAAKTVDSGGVAMIGTLLLSVGVCLFGAGNAIVWLRQLERSGDWIRRWYRTALQLEQAGNFRETLGRGIVEVYSDESTRKDIMEQQTGTGAQMYEIFAWTSIVMYALVILFVVFYVGHAYTP